jgi:glycosyltransferase involved in cell wall biosynthesis
MRIVMAAHSFPRAEGDIAGAFLWRLAEALVDRGHGVTVVAPADRGEVGAPLLGKVRVRRVRYAAAAHETLAYQGTMHRLATSPVGALNFARLVRAMGRAVTEEVRASSANIIHAHWWIPGGLAVRLGDRAGRPYVVTLHGTDVALARKLPLGHAAMKWVLSPAAAVTAVSSFLANEAAQSLGLAAPAIPLTPMPLALGRSADPDAARSGAIFVGRLTKQKAVHDLLAALAILKREGAPQDLTIVGDGPERAALKAQAIALGLNVTFTGFVPPEQVAGYLRDKRVFVLPSLDEGLGLVVAEALTQGVPVVATRSGGIPDLLADPDAGILVPHANPGALAHAIRCVVVEDRFRVGAWRAGKVLAERLSPEKVAEGFEAIYARVRGGRPSAAAARVSGRA